MPKFKHSTVHVEREGFCEAEIDVAIAELILGLWNADIHTIMCCQEESPGWIRIDFQAAEAEKFLNLVVKLQGEAPNQVGFDDDITHRIVGMFLEDVDDAWEVALGVFPEEDEKVYFFIQIQFPISDYPEVLRRVIAST